MNISLFCVGNELMLDDGIGPAVYDELKSYSFSGPGFQADAIDPFSGGTSDTWKGGSSKGGSSKGGSSDGKSSDEKTSNGEPEPSQVAIFNLACMSLDYVEVVNKSDLIISVDAVDGTGEEPGTVFRYSPDDLAGRSPATTSLHDLKLKDLFDAASFLGYNAKGLCFGMQVKNPDPPTHMIGLTTPVHEKLGNLVDAVLAELVHEGVQVTEIATGKKVGPGFHHTLQIPNEIHNAN